MDPCHDIIVAKLHPGPPSKLRNMCKTFILIWIRNIIYLTINFKIDQFIKLSTKGRQIGIREMDPRLTITWLKHLSIKDLKIISRINPK